MKRVYEAFLSSVRWVGVFDRVGAGVDYWSACSKDFLLRILRVL